MATLYVIPNWEKDFENSKSQHVVKATWFAVQNNFDGRMMRRLVRLKNAAELYGSFHAICAIASRCPYRGVLLDERGPIGAIDIADKTGFEVKHIDRALKELSQPFIALLETHEIEEVDGEWPLPVPVRRWALHETSRRLSASSGGPARPREDAEAREQKEIPLPRNASPRDPPRALASPEIPARPREDAEARVGPRREEKGTEDPPTVPQGGQEGISGFGFTEAKAFLDSVFGREKRKWSREEDGLLSDIVPIPLHHAQMIRQWFSLPADHPIFDPKSNPSTKRKQELTTFLRDYNGELDKMLRFAPLFVNASRNGQKKKEPARWREFFQWKYPDGNLPETFAGLGPDQRAEYERDFQTFERAMPLAGKKEKGTFE